MSTYILPFSSSEATLARVGGKGAHLAHLVQAGFSVPDGFILTTDAYHAFIDANQLQTRILALVKTVSPDDPDTFEQASAKLYALFDHAAMPAEISADIIAA